jgi:hypothetical protein
MLDSAGSEFTLTTTPDESRRSVAGPMRVRVDSSSERRPCLPAAANDLVVKSRTVRPAPAVRSTTIGRQSNRGCFCATSQRRQYKSYTSSKRENLRWLAFWNWHAPTSSRMAAWREPSVPPTELLNQTHPFEGVRSIFCDLCGRKNPVETG